MKTISIFILFLIFQHGNSQSLLSENFENYNLGDMSTAVSPVGSTNPTFGQGGWITMATNPNAISPSSVSIVNAAASAYSKVQQIEGSLDTDVFSVKDIASLWNTRNSGNDILSTTFDFYVSGSTTGPATYIEFDVMDGSRTKVLGGYILFLNTLELRGIVYGSSNGTTNANSTIRLLPSPGLILIPNTWYKLNIEINKTTGEVKWSSPQLSMNVSRQAYSSTGVFGTSIQGLDPAELDYVNWQVVSPTSSMIDNIQLVAKNNNNLQVLEVNADSKIKLYPNPSKNYINIKGGKENAEKVIVDSSGKVIIKTLDKKINISHLPAGKYFINIIGEHSSSYTFIKE